MITKRNIYINTAVLFFMLLFAACVDDLHVSPTATNKNSVKFILRVPGIAEPNTYALSYDDENAVQSLDFLLFENEVLVDLPVSISAYAVDPDDSRFLSFNTQIPKGIFDIVLIANAHNEIVSSVDSSSIGLSKTEVLSQLKISNAGKWRVKKADQNFDPIPMWGEIKDFSVPKTPHPVVEVPMIRTLAKINVFITESASENFILTSVRIHNYYDKACIVPAGENWDDENLTVTAPTIPEDAKKPAGVAQCLIYDTVWELNDSGCENSIYLFESEISNDGDQYFNETCLVIGGYYQDDLSPSYYRVDFANLHDGIRSNLPLLRNHLYKININTITHRGFTTPLEAFVLEDHNHSTEIIFWDESKFNEVVFNENTMLGVSESNLYFSKDQYNNASNNNFLYVTTNNWEGWTVQRIVDVDDVPIDWLTLTPTSGSQHETNEIRLLLDENMHGARIAYIYLRAGKLMHKITVHQEGI